MKFIFTPERQPRGSAHEIEIAQRFHKTEAMCLGFHSLRGRKLPHGSFRTSVFCVRQNTDCRKTKFSTVSDLKISGEASGDERRAALAVRDVKRMVAEGRERVPVVQVGVKHEIVFAAGEVRADLCVVQAGNGGERLDGRRKARSASRRFSPLRYSS